MGERSGVITFKGNAMTLEGDGVSVGDQAPDFTVIAQDFSEKKLGDYKGKTVILNIVPSLDTGVCDTQTRTFNKRAAEIDDAAIVTVSMDLPPAQKRWCGAAGVDKVECVSDFRDRSFAEAFGLRIKELGLLARAVYVIDKDGKIVYEQIVPEVTTEPDYDAALNAAKSA